MKRAGVVIAMGAAWGGLVVAAAGALPQYDHVVVVIEENKGYGTIIGSSSAPYINKLANEGTKFTNFYAFNHTSAPNYGELFAGFHNFIPDNGIAPGVPLTTPNVGAEIRAAGFSFGGYAQSLPSVGYTGEFSGDYVRRHNPWVNWQNDAANAHPNQLPSATNMPFTMFPADYSQLPTFSFVVPDNVNNMHDSGAGPISTADTWLKNNIDGYYQWAKTHNSLLMVIYDEDGHEANNYNRIPTIFAGAGVRAGASVGQTYTLHNFLRTVEDLYGTAHARAAANVRAMTGAFVDDVPSATKIFREGQGGYTGSHDTHIRQDQATTAFGTATILEVNSDDNAATGNQAVQTLVRFDNLIGTAAGQIPAGASIASAKLILWSDAATGAESTDFVNVHRMLGSWSESSTWNSLGGGVVANDAEAKSAADFSLAPGVLNHPGFFDVSDTLQAWADGAANNGWALLPSGPNDYRFYSTDAANAVSLRPGLEVTYFLISRWNSATGSSWGNAANWAGGVPNGVGTVVNLGDAVSGANATISMDGSRTIGKLTFDHTSSYIIAPGTGGTLTIDNGGLSPAVVKVVRGNHTILAGITIADDAEVDVASGASLNVTGATTVSAGRRVVKLSGGQLNVTNLSLGSGATLAVDAGTVAGSISGSGALEIGGGAMVLSGAGNKVNGLVFDGGGKLDMSSSSLVVQASSGTRLSVLDAIVEQIRIGRNSTATRWAGAGIASSTAAADATRRSAIGAMLNDNGSGGVLYSTFFGLPVDINSVLIRYTLNGDLNLDGDVDPDDFARIDAGFAQRLGGWGNGDIDYSGTVDADDFFLIDHAHAGGTSMPAPGGFGPVSVPEPGWAAAVFLGSLALRRRGGRRL